MAIKGLSAPVVATYNLAGNTVTYSDLYRADKAVEYSVALETSEDNPLYADNGIAENDRGKFVRGTLTLGTSDLSQEMSKRILGVKTREIQVGDKVITESVFDDERKAGAFGFGIIELHQINGADVYRAVWLAKVTFNIPEDAATTKGKEISWQTKSTTAVIERSDHVEEGCVHPWKFDAWCSSEEEALAYFASKCVAAAAQ